MGKYSILGNHGGLCTDSIGARGRRYRVYAPVQRHDQVYFYALGDGSFTRLTEHGASISGIRWSPDGQTLYFVAPRLRGDEESRLLDGDWVIEPYDTSRNREIWTLDTRSSATVPLVAGDFSVRSVSVSRDGRQLVYRRVPSHEVDASHDAVYVGTVSLETSFHSGYYGFNGTVDDYTVSNDCAADCSARLGRLGLSADSLDVALLQEQYHLAQRQ